MFEKICSIFCGGHDTDAQLDTLRTLLSADGRGIVSARCCAPMAAQSDDAMQANLREALAAVGESDEHQFISITDAQKTLPKMNKELTPAQQRLVMQIQGMVSSQGFSIFPMLLIGGQIAYYGGIPSAEMIREKLPGSATLEPERPAVMAAQQ